MNDSFRLDKNSNIILYGAGANGTIFYNILTSRGYKITSYVDKRAKEINSIEGLRVIDTKDIEVTDNTIVIITIKNVFEHDEIARKLLLKGVENIIYRPKIILEGSKDTRLSRLNDVYDIIFNMKYKEKSIELEPIDNIPKTNDIISYEYKDYAILKRENNGVIVNIPIQMIFTSQRKLNPRYEWNEKTILSLPHIALFEYFNGISKNSNQYYIDFCINGATENGIKITEEWKSNLISNRYVVFNEMCKALEMDSEFFVRNAEKGLWNTEDCYFNINGARHRTTFLCSKNHKYMPLHIGLEDYEKYLNTEIVKEIINYFNKENIRKVSVEIPHPYFYRFPVKKDRYMSLVLKNVIKEISFEYFELKRTLNFNNKSFLYCGDDNGEMARQFIKMGFNVNVISQCGNLELLLNKLFYVKTIKYINSNGLTRYDYAYLNEKILDYDEAVIIDIVKRTRKFIFIEGIRSVIEKIKGIIEDKIEFVKYKTITETYWSGSDIEIGVIINDNKLE